MSPSKDDLDDEQLSWLKGDKRKIERALRDQDIQSSWIQRRLISMTSTMERHIMSELLKQSSPTSRLPWLLERTRYLSISFSLPFLQRTKLDWTTLELLKSHNIITRLDYVDIVGWQVTSFDHYQYLTRDSNWTDADHQTCFDIIVGRGQSRTMDLDLETQIQSTYKTGFRPFVSWLSSIMYHAFSPPPTEVVTRCKNTIQQHNTTHHTLITPRKGLSSGIHVYSAKEYIRWMFDYCTAEKQNHSTVQQINSMIRFILPYSYDPESTLEFSIKQ
eukprot:GILJ01015649.1.p1 GENE.GILJ01015649.1~~GILJ01015649.1.p1  ORF type:complete len:274 (+),score=21.98 GILJ01015649.1:1029-1850(+)